MGKILVVDDSEVQRKEVKSILQTAGYQVVEAGNGVEGLEAIKSHPDLILIVTDLNMPKMDGITMCSRIKQLNLPKPIPAFMLTTESTPELKTAGKEAGIMLWVVKPFVSEKFLAAVKKVVGS